MSAAVAVTFDNFGEVSDLERGRWPDAEPLGRHFSVTRALPRVIDLLATVDVRATFFVEGLNAELYPDALREVAAAGHEIALHGWRHETWSEVAPARERELLERGINALDEVGLHPVGFRPPGGILARSSRSALTELGFAYCSPAGGAPEVRYGLATLPFRWELIDAFHYLPHFASRRQEALGSADLLSPAAFRVRVEDALQEAARRDEFLTLLFHPFLADTEERLAAMKAVLHDLRALIDNGAAWSAPMRDIARSLSAGPGMS